MRFFSIPFGVFSRSFSLFRIASTPSFFKALPIPQGQSLGLVILRKRHRLKAGGKTGRGNQETRTVCFGKSW